MHGGTDGNRPTVLVREHVLAVVTSAGRTLLRRGRDRWTLSGGLVEHHDGSPEQALSRHFRQQVGAEVIELKGQLGPAVSEAAMTSDGRVAVVDRYTAYLTECRGTPVPTAETAEVGWFDTASLAAMPQGAVVGTEPGSMFGAIARLIMLALTVAAEPIYFGDADPEIQRVAKVRLFDSPNVIPLDGGKYVARCMSERKGLPRLCIWRAVRSFTPPTFEPGSLEQTESTARKLKMRCAA